MTSARPKNHDDVRPAALLLHGMSLNDTVFPDLGIPAVTPDLSDIALGGNGVTPELERDGFGVFERNIEAVLTRSECWEDARRIVVGHSFGGMLALHWLSGRAGDGPDAVHGLVLVATTAGPMYQSVRLRIPYANRWNLRVPVGWLIPTWNRPLITKMVKRMACGGGLEAERVDFRAAGIQSDAELGRAGWRNTDWRAMRAFRFAMGGFDVRDRLGRIDIPAIVLHGTEDLLFDVAEARQLADLLPSAEMRLIREAGHALPVTHGAELVQAVSDLAQG